MFETFCKIILNSTRIIGIFYSYTVVTATMNSIHDNSVDIFSFSVTLYVIYVTGYCIYLLFDINVYLTTVSCYLNDFILLLPFVKETGITKLEKALLNCYSYLLFSHISRKV